MKCFRDVINAWPSLSDFGSDLGITRLLAQQWRRRDSIPAGYWPRLIEKAAERGIAGVAAEALMEFAKQNLARRRDGAEAA